MNYLSAHLQIKVLNKLKEMFIAMKEHARYYRFANAF
jgi:hypothetical protein